MNFGAKVILVTDTQARKAYNHFNEIPDSTHEDRSDEECPR